MIKYLQLQHLFDAAKMQKELELVGKELWQQHYNKKDYEGDWTVLPLRSIQGRPDNVISVHSSAAKEHVYQDTALLEKCEYLQSVLGFFECEKPPFG